jgi:YgiT-type zinc finger domain-containing protein
MSKVLRTFHVTACPSCGSTAIRAAKRDWSGNYKGRRYVVRSLRYYQCPRCGEKVYNPEAMRRIQAASPAFSKNQRARKSA